MPAILHAPPFTCLLVFLSIFPLLFRIACFVRAKYSAAECSSYQVVGNDRLFASLNEVVQFHSRYPVTDDGDLLVLPCLGKGERKDLQELM
jgi:hypothetical protein